MLRPEGSSKLVEALLDHVLGLDGGGDDLLDGKEARRDHAGDAGPDRRGIAPGRLERDVLQRPEHGVDRGGTHVQADLHDRAAPPHRLGAAVERGFEPDAFERHVDAHALLGVVLDECREVDLARVDHHGIGHEAARERAPVADWARRR